MNKFHLTLIVFILLTTIVKAQTTPTNSPCSDAEILKRLIEVDPNPIIEMETIEAFTNTFVQQLKAERAQKNGHKTRATYTIPVVLHVFHNGDEAKIDMAQAQSGIDILNTDYNGLNTDWNTIDPRFDSIKATLDIRFCLATKDPAGNPTTGVNYYDDSLMMLNQGNLFQYAWDNYKYLNIYLPKYTGGSPSLFTAYAYFPNTANSNANQDGVFYSSIRWGYGSNSELTSGQEWASVGTHEIGHWLNLRHTFEGGCNATNDGVGDTPPTLGGTIELSGCKNNDSSCGVPTNGENYMDYNHDCKKMFTQGQVDRMTAALNLPVRSSLWDPTNLLATGCVYPANVAELANKQSIIVYPNPATDHINFQFDGRPTRLTIHDMYGNLISDIALTQQFFQLNVNNLASRLYFYSASFGEVVVRGKFIKN